MALEAPFLVAGFYYLVSGAGAEIMGDASKSKQEMPALRD
jgi:hypothetical protein